MALTLRRRSFAAARAAFAGAGPEAAARDSERSRRSVAVAVGGLSAWLCITICLGLPGATRARAEDPAERAAQIRDEILAKRRVQEERGTAVRGQEQEQEQEQARDRLERIRADIDAATERRERVSAQHERIVARLAELDAASRRERALQRARVAAIHRAAHLGAGAAGWQPGVSATSIRLARYLVATAARGGGKQAMTLEVERGSHIAALAQSRLEEQSAADELRRLQDSRAVAENEFERAQSQLAAAVAQAGVRSEVAAMEDSEAHPTEAPLTAAVTAGKAAADSAMPRQRADEALGNAARIAEARARDDAEALAQARTRAASARQRADASRDPGGAAQPLPQGSVFDWSAQQRGAAAAPGRDRGSPSADGAQAAPPAERDGRPATAKAATAESETQSPKRGLLSRLFGTGGEEAQRFAASKGALAAPVSGRVVAKFGQRHENGATYRGVIVRGSRGSAVKSVAGGAVLFAGSLPGLGNTVIVSHGGRYHTVYARLGTLRFKEGELVNADDVVGALPAEDGDLHFEMRQDGRAIDPLPWLQGTGKDQSAR